MTKFLTHFESEASPLNLFDGAFSIVTSGLFTLCSDPEAKKGELTDTQSDMSQCDIVTHITDTKEYHTGRSLAK